MQEHLRHDQPPRQRREEGGGKGDLAGVIPDQVAREEFVPGVKLGMDQMGGNGGGVDLHERLRQGVEAAPVGPGPVGPAMQHRQEGMLAVAQRQFPKAGLRGQKDARGFQHSGAEIGARAPDRAAALKMQGHGAVALIHPGHDGAGAIGETGVLAQVRQRVARLPDQPVRAAMQAKATEVASGIDRLPSLTGGHPHPGQRVPPPRHPRQQLARLRRRLNPPPPRHRRFGQQRRQRIGDARDRQEPGDRAVMRRKIGRRDGPVRHVARGIGQDGRAPQVRQPPRRAGCAERKPAGQVGHRLRPRLHREIGPVAAHLPRRGCELRCHPAVPVPRGPAPRIVRGHGVAAPGRARLKRLAAIDHDHGPPARQKGHRGRHPGGAGADDDMRALSHA